MYCLQESEDPLNDPYSSETDPFASITAVSDDEEPPPKKANMGAFKPSLNLTVYKIPVFNQDYKKYDNNTVKERCASTPPPPAMFSSPHTYDLTPVRYKKNGEIAKKRGPPKGYKRKPKSGHIAPYVSSSLTITPVPAKPMPPLIKLPTDTSLTITPTYYKSADARIPTDVRMPAMPKAGCLPKVPVPTVQEMAAMTQALANPALGSLTLVQRNAILSGLLMSNAMKMTDKLDIQELLKQIGVPPFSVPSSLSITPELQPQRVAVPKGAEIVTVDCTPADWFPEEPYRMSFSRKKNPKWKSFPHRCEYCFKGYRVASSLVAHAGERHGAVPRDLAIPCPCCQHVSVRRKQHRRHLAGHAVRRGKLFCLYCIPPQDPTEAYVPETTRYPFDDYPQFYYASEESLRLHRKRKHPYAAMLNVNWQYSWMEGIPNS